MKIGKDTLSYAGPIAEGLGIMTGSKELRGLGKIASGLGEVNQHKQTRKDIKKANQVSNASNGATKIDAFHSTSTNSGSVNDNYA